MRCLVDGFVAFYLRLVLLHTTSCIDFVFTGLNASRTTPLFRQMQILYTNGYSDKQLLDFRLSIWGYLLDTSRRIAQDLRDSHLEPANLANKVRSLTPVFAPHDFIPLGQFRAHLESPDGYQKSWVPFPTRVC